MKSCKDLDDQQDDIDQLLGHECKQEEFCQDVHSGKLFSSGEGASLW